MPAALPDLPPNIFTNIPRVKPVDSVTVLLLDSLNTPLADQSFVRGQLMKYLKTVQPGRRVAIFTLGTRLRFVEGFSDDPAVLAAALNNPQNGSSPRHRPCFCRAARTMRTSSPWAFFTRISPPIHPR